MCIKIKKNVQILNLKNIFKILHEMKIIFHGFKNNIFKFKVDPMANLLTIQSPLKIRNSIRFEISD